MTEIIIIDINLGEIDKIIAEDVATLHGEAAEILETAIQERKQLDALRVKRETEKASEVAAVTETLQAAYDALLNAASEGITADKVLEMVQPTIPNASAFSLRMKTMLREAGNNYVLKRKKLNKTAHYILEEFNVIESEEKE